jgi:hypothetical protein
LSKNTAIGIVYSLIDELKKINMNYQEAEEHKKESLQNADESVLKLFHVVITPANTDESAKYIEDFLKSPESFNDESCKEYCSDGNYEVVSFKKEKEE